MRRRISIRGRVRPSVRPSVCPSRVIFEGEKYAYKAHLVPCIRPCSWHVSIDAFLEERFVMSQTTGNRDTSDSIFIQFLQLLRKKRKITSTSSVMKRFAWRSVTPSPALPDVPLLSSNMSPFPSFSVNTNSTSKLVRILRILGHCNFHSNVRSPSPVLRTVKPRYSVPAFNIIPPIEHTNFGPKKCFHSYSYIG